MSKNVSSVSWFRRFVGAGAVVTLLFSLSLFATQKDDCEKLESRLDPQNAQSTPVIPISVSLPEYSNQVSLLFFKGPPPQLQDIPESMRGRLKLGTLVFHYNRGQDVTAIVSAFGVGHKQLAQAVPEGAEILGGSRYREADTKKPERVNSMDYGEHDGPVVEDQYFKVAIKSNHTPAHK